MLRIYEKELKSTNFKKEDLEILFSSYEKTIRRVNIFLNSSSGRINKNILERKRKTEEKTKHIQGFIEEFFIQELNKPFDIQDGSGFDIFYKSSELIEWKITASVSKDVWATGNKYSNKTNYVFCNKFSYNKGVVIDHGSSLISDGVWGFSKCKNSGFSSLKLRVGKSKIIATTLKGFEEKRTWIHQCLHS